MTKPLHTDFHNPIPKHCPMCREMVYVKSCPGSFYCGCDNFILWSYEQNHFEISIQYKSLSFYFNVTPTQLIYLKVYILKSNYNISGSSRDQDIFIEKRDFKDYAEFAEYLDNFDGHLKKYAKLLTLQ